MRCCFLALGLLLLLSGGLSGCSSDGERPRGAHSSEGHTELAAHMATLQRWTHKTTLALEARNPALADFYLHEMEESIGTIKEDVPTYEGHAIADLTEKMLGPSVEALDGALDERNWEAVDARVQDLSRACNQCHAATDHGFVRIDLDDVPNPYAQDFSPASP